MSNGTYTSLSAALKDLKERKNLTKVDLTNVDVRDAGLSDLLFVLRKQTGLRELILANCGLGVPAARHLATFLKYNKSVSRLYLQHNKRLGDEGIEELATALKSNKNVEVLNLANCNVGNVGAAALCENAGSIKKLYLYNNQIEAIGATAMAEMILKKTTLLELFAWDNPLSEKGLDALKEAHMTMCKEASDKGPFCPRLNLVVGLRNEKIAKKKAPATKRNFTVPKDREKSTDIDTSNPGEFASLKAQAQSLAGESIEVSTFSVHQSKWEPKPPNACQNRDSTRCNVSIYERSDPLSSKANFVGDKHSTSPPSKATKIPVCQTTPTTKQESPDKPLHVTYSDCPAKHDAGVPLDNEEPVIDDEIARLEAEIAALQDQIKSTTS